ncbi:MAG: alanine--tRNA ligase, partial [Rhodospirillum sp.]|nr:alanine--tRNA ligase [Rhodospirillum sp.]
GAVASGVRRIEAVTGQAALDYVETQDKLISDSAALLKVAPADLPERIQALLDDRRKLERELADVRKKLATGGGGGAAPEIKDIGGGRFIGRLFEDVPAKELKGMADEMKKQVGSGAVALISVAEGKASLVVAVTEDLTGKVDAVALVRAGSAVVGGKGGGGRPDMAQAGGPDGDKAGEAMAAIEAALAG